jgi:hypothetical protein
MTVGLANSYAVLVAMPFYRLTRYRSHRAARERVFKYVERPQREITPCTLNV